MSTPDEDLPDDRPGSDTTDAPEVADGGDEDTHTTEGLDFARSQMRGIAGSSTTPAKRRPRRDDGGPRPEPGTGRARRTGPQFSGARPDRRDPQGLAAEVGRLIGDRGWGLDLQVRGVFARWGEIVGAEIGAHSTPESLVDGKLVVRTDSTAWATQLKLFASTVVKRLNEELGDGTVTVVEVLGPLAPSWKHGRRGISDARGPRDTYG